MITITMPDNNVNERRYIIDIIFKEFLDLEYKLKIGSDNYEIIMNNGSKLIFEDHFFNDFPNNLEYLKLGNIPTSITINKIIVMEVSFSTYQPNIDPIDMENINIFMKRF